jgi:general secretion pathway protein D
VQAADGRINAGVSRNTAAGTPGQGSVVQVKLKATAAGPAEVKLLWFELVSTGDQRPKANVPLVHSMVVK